MHRVRKRIKAIGIHRKLHTRVVNASLAILASLDGSNNEADGTGRRDDDAGECLHMLASGADLAREPRRLR